MGAQYHESLRGDLADTAAETDSEPCQVEEDGINKSSVSHSNQCLEARWGKGGDV